MSGSGALATNTAAAVPEPAAIWLVLCGIAYISFARRCAPRAVIAARASSKTGSWSF
ncbi:MAG: PEP-CTERM sorting domain-containing protein [Lysobacterales bacterium]|nr:MAG: PEP-CTERM sorting domain-containing protein [Xanthomonadales bacterium]